MAIPHPRLWWPDALGLGGALAMLHGIAAWSSPLAWVVGGLMAVALALRSAMSERPATKGTVQ